MKMRSKKRKPSDEVVLTGLPAGFLDDLPDEDQLAISQMVGKRIKVNGFDEDGRAELEFRDPDGNLHTIWVKRTFVKSTQKSS